MEVPGQNRSTETTFGAFRRGAPRVGTLGNSLKSAQALALRARIVLSCARPGTTNLRVAAELGVNPATSASGAPGTWPSASRTCPDEDRPGAPRRITDDKIES